MKKLVNKLLSFVFVSAMCIISLQLPILAQDPTIEEPVQSEVESQTLNLQDQIQEPILINEFSYVNLNESIIKKTLSEEEKQNKTEEEIIELEKQLGYECKKIDLEAPYTKTQLNEELPKSIKAQTDSEEIEIPITWKLDNIEDEIKDGIYTLTPTIPEDYKLSDTISSLDIELTVSYKKVEEDKQQDNIQENKNDDLAHINNPVNASNNIVTAFDIKWHNTNDTNIIVESNYNHQATKVRAELTFSLSQANIEKGKIQIRLPAKIYTNREGNKHGDYEIILNSTMSYEYTEDKENNEIVITNTSDITNAHTLVVQIDYSDYKEEVVPNLIFHYPSEIINYSRHPLKATYSIDLDEESIFGETNEIEVTHVINTKLDTVYGKKPEKVSWDSSWGDKPNDSIFIKYTYNIDLEEQPATMPFRIDIEKDGSYESTNTNNEYNGKIVDWSCEHTLDENVKITEKESGDGWILENYDKSNYYGYGINLNFVVAYPKSSLGNKTTIREKITVTLTPYYKEDGTAVQMDYATLSYLYETFEFEYPEGNYDIDKKDFYGYEMTEKVIGGIDKIRLVKDNTPIHMEGYSNLATVEGGALTLKDDGNRNDLEDYEQKSYTMEAYDDLMILNGERLLPGDYSFPSVTIANYRYYTVVPNEDTGGAEYKEITDTSKEAIDIYYNTSLDKDNWKLYGSVTVDEENNYIFDSNNGNDDTSKDEIKISLPENTVGVKAITKSKKAKTIFELKVDVNLYGTSHMKEIMEELESKDIKNIDLYNVSTITVKDSNGKWVNPSTPNTIYGSLKDIVEKHDIDIYGENYRAQHDYHEIELQSLTKDSFSGKVIKNFEISDEGYFYAECSIAFGNYFDASTNAITKDDLKNYNLLPEESHGKIYDLLPMGAFVDESTVKIGRSLNDTLNSFWFSEIEDSVVSINYENNWRNSGRTMVIFDIQIPDDFDNIYAPSSSLFKGSSLAVRFNLVYPYESVTDYGINLRNLAAYESDNDLFSGLPDNADSNLFTEEEKAWFRDINGDGKTDDETPKNMLYAICDTQVSKPISSEFGCSKKVKNNSDILYTKSTNVIQGENYSYNLRIGNKDFLETKDIVLFDVIEEAHDSNPHWKGTLESVDVSQPIGIGVNPVIYYSLKQDIELNEDDIKNLTGDADIDDKSIWTTFIPNDKSKIKAIAVDMRKTNDDSDFVLEKIKTLTVIVNMKAPEAGIDKIEGTKAYNESWLSSDVKLVNTNKYNPNSLLCNPTEVSIRSPNINIYKSSDPETGTSEKPTMVEEHSSILYDVAIHNEEQSKTLFDIITEDEIPTGLDIDYKKIKYYYNDDKNAAKLVSDSDDGISVDRDTTNTQKLTFNINELQGNTSIHLMIPTKVSTDDKNIRYENQAVITKIGNFEINKQSNITYHEKILITTFAFVKTDKSQSPITGAGFALYEKKCTENHDELLNVDEEGNLDLAQQNCWEKVTDQTIKGSYYEFNGLRTDKEYRLVEYKAPMGYVKPKGQWILRFDNDLNDFSITSIENPPAFVDPTSGTKATDTTLKLPNYTIEELPTTGGRGILRFMWIGTPIMLIGGYLIIRNKRKKA